MNTRPLLTRFLALGVLGAVLTFTLPARAADRRTEAAAKFALKKAEADFAAAAYDKGLARLQKAATACGATVPRSDGEPPTGGPAQVVGGCTSRARPPGGGHGLPPVLASPEAGRWRPASR